MLGLGKVAEIGLATYAVQYDFCPSHLSFVIYE